MTKYHTSPPPRLAVFLFFVLLVLAACISPVPVTISTNGIDEIVTDEEGDTVWDWTWPWSAKEKTDRALNSKGFKRYKADASQIAAMEWINISKYAGWATGLFLLGWYFTKIRELAGAAVISIVFSLISVMMAELVTKSQWLVLIVVGIAAVLLGIAYRNKTITTYLRKLLK